MRQHGEGAFDPRFGKGGVNGAAGNLGGLGGPATPIPGMLGGPNTTGAPVGYNPLNQVQTGMIPGDPMSQIGNAGAFNVAHSMVDPAGNFIPGTDTRELHNTNTIDGGRGSADPSTMNERHLDVPPGTRLDNSNIDRSGTPSYGWNQSSNLPGAIPGVQMAQLPQSMIAQGQQTQTSNLLNPLDWFSGRNQQTADEVEKGTYKGGKGGGIDKMIRRTSDLNNLINQM